MHRGEGALPSQAPFPERGVSDGEALQPATFEVIRSRRNGDAFQRVYTFNDRAGTFPETLPLQGETHGFEKA